MNKQFILMKLKLVLLLGALFFLSACNKWLDVELADKVTQEKLFSTPQGYQEALAGVYSQMADSSLYGKKLSMEVMDLMGDYYGTNNVAARYAKLRAYDYKDAGSQVIIAKIWNQLYSAIGGANNIIEWANKDVNVLSPDLKNQILGEAYALRAYLHCDLMRMFCPDVVASPKASGIPYNLVFGVSLPPIYTVEENVQLVIDDLKAAEKYLANDPITKVKPYEMVNKNEADKYVARFNLYGVKALLARVSLMRGDKNNAIKYAKEVVESQRFRLLDFASVDKSEKEIDMLFSDEHIFSLRNKKLSDFTTEIHYSHTDDKGTTTLAFLPFANVAQLYEANNDDIRYIKWFSTTDGSFIKYKVDNKDKFFPKMPMIKLSEMYLILAECYLGKDDQQAQSYINQLRDHRIRNNAHWSYLTMEYIMRESQREFLGEGQLWYAMKRWIQGMPNIIFVFPMPLKEIETGNRN
ncbi:RagB/SusD family nutrient uptake outer membrane protein [Sphingobacterium puteale]|uniref:RagB/SusD family nutrient uptake outer membrane protein n=2 Tax=Sphingobacterium puteale TaxID=2420510 RepID=A0A420W1A9_9SPHI|nr:RagB/SusD family nutrient uptake outer membrane protein [Sphingobacterium puteale]